MRNFVLGIIVAFVLIGLGGISLGLLGLFPTQADKSPSSLERRSPRMLSTHLWSVTPRAIQSLCRNA